MRTAREVATIRRTLNGTLTEPQSSPNSSVVRCAARWQSSALHGATRC